MNLRSLALILFVGCLSATRTSEDTLKTKTLVPPFPATAQECIEKKNLSLIANSNFSITKDGFSFENYPNYEGVINLTLIEMKRLFGNSILIKTEQNPTKEYLRLNAARWMQEVNETMDAGHCEGMAVLSQLLYYNIEKSNNFGAGITHELILNKNEKLQREIAYWYSTQFFSNATNKRKISSVPSDNESGREIIIEELKKSLSAGKSPKESWVLGIYLLNGGHAVTPIKLREDANSYFIDVYDSSQPGEEHYIKINKSDKEKPFYSAWGFELDSYDIESIKHRLKKRAYIFPGEITNGSKHDDGTQIIAKGNVNVAFKDEMGNSIQPEKIVLKYGKPDWRVNSSVYIISTEHKEFTIIVTGKAHAKKTNSGSKLSVITPTSAFGIEDIMLKESESDTVKIINKGGMSKLIYQTKDKESPDINICSKNSVGDFEYSIRGIDLISEYGFLEVALNSTTGNLSINSKNNIDSDLFDLLVCSLNENGKHLFNTNNIAMGKDMTIQVILDDWLKGEENLELLYDFGSNDTIDKSELFQNMNTILEEAYFYDWEIDTLMD